MFLFIYFLLSETSRSNTPFVVLHDYAVLHDLNFPVTKLAKWWGIHNIGWKEFHSL